MNLVTEYDKPKDKKKTFVERLLYFASHTMRINRKNKINKTKARNALDNLVSQTMVPIETQTLTFCDYCNQKIVADFTGQNIICHDYCKRNDDQRFLIENNADLEKSLQLLNSTKSDLLTSSTEIRSNAPSNLYSRLSISLNDLSIHDNHFSLNMRSDLDGDGDLPHRDSYLVDIETGSYTFSTVDLSTIKQFGIFIKKVEPDIDNNSVVTRIEVPRDSSSLERESCVSLNYTMLLPDEIRVMMDVFNSNEQGLFIEPKNEQIMGKIRVFINLLRPIKMLLTARPPSTFELLTDGIINPDTSTIDRAYHNQEVIFWLPRGTSKVMYININSQTNDVISLLLAKFNIQNNPKKFALYQHTIKSPKEVEVCKLKAYQCPLKIMLDWCKKGTEYFHRNLETRRFVLQENDPGSVDWDEFSVPELTSFLKILDQEKDEKKYQISLKYDRLREEIHRQMSLK